MDELAWPFLRKRGDLLRSGVSDWYSPTLDGREPSALSAALATAAAHATARAAPPPWMSGPWDDGWNRNGYKCYYD